LRETIRTLMDAEHLHALQVELLHKETQELQKKSHEVSQIKDQLFKCLDNPKEYEKWTASLTSLLQCNTEEAEKLKKNLCK
jgi:DNA polymerase III psi subunit